MWVLALVRGGTEFSVRDALRVESFLPYTVEKVISHARVRGRAVHKSVWTKVPRWPRYIFVEAKNLSLTLKTKGVLALVRSADNEPSVLPNKVMDTLRLGCAPDGKVLRSSSLHSFGVGDLLRFVSSSNFALVLSNEDSGDLNLLVNGHLKVRAHYTELAPAIV